MPTNLSQEVLDALPDDVRKNVEAVLNENETLRKTAEAQNPSEETTPVEKREDIPEDIRKQFTEMAERAEAAEAIAKAERAARELRDWRDRVAKLNNLPVGDVVKNEAGESAGAEGLAAELKKVADHDSDLANGIYTLLKAMNEQARTSKLFEEVGKQEAFTSSAEGQLESVAKNLREKDSTLSEAGAFAKATEMHPELYERYLAEQEG